jgi:fumarate reductase subunit C
VEIGPFTLGEKIGLAAVRRTAELSELKDVKTKEYLRPMPATWWLHNRYLIKFMIRELTSFFVLGSAVFLMILLYQANRGTEHFLNFYDQVLRSGWLIFLEIVALAFVVFHSVTSFNAAPTIMAARWGEEPINPRIVIGANYALWLIVSLVVLILIL